MYLAYLKPIDDVLVYSLKRYLLNIHRIPYVYLIGSRWVSNEDERDI